MFTDQRMHRMNFLTHYVTIPFTPTALKGVEWLIPQHTTSKYLKKQQEILKFTGEQKGFKINKTLVRYQEMGTGSLSEPPSPPSFI